MQKIFYTINKNLLNETEKHFKRIELWTTNTDKSLILDDNPFSDITFDEFQGHRINNVLLGNKAFGKSATTIKKLSCEYCAIENSPPNYDVWKSLSTLIQLNSLSIGLNVTEIPTNAILPKDGSESQLQYFTLKSFNNITIRSSAFQYLKNLTELRLDSMKIERFQDESFKFNSNTSNDLYISFVNTTVLGESFQTKTFNGNQRTVLIELTESDINFIPELTFKPFLSNGKNEIHFSMSSPRYSHIDCEDCRNFWMIRDNKMNQVQNALCKNDSKKLFDPEIQLKLKTKCKF